MAHYKSRRKGNSATFTIHDPSRFLKVRDRWYFNTREGTTEGPFSSPQQAEDNLDSYISLMGLYLDTGEEQREDGP
jgi:hypothetical protein